MSGRSSWPQMRLRRPARVDDKPAENGRVRVRLRDPDQPAAGRASVRRLARPLPLVGALLVLAALVGYWSVYSATTERTPVLVAARDLQAGAMLRPADLRTAELAGEAGTLAALVPERELETVLGRELSTPVSQGAPLARAAVAPAGDAPAAFTLVVPALRALGGSLRARRRARKGDRGGGAPAHRAGADAGRRTRGRAPSLRPCGGARAARERGR